MTWTISLTFGNITWHWNNITQSSKATINFIEHITSQCGKKNSYNTDLNFYEMKTSNKDKKTHKSTEPWAVSETLWAHANETISIFCSIIWFIMVMGSFQDRMRTQSHSFSKPWDKPVSHFLVSSFVIWAVIKPKSYY